MTMETVAPAGFAIRDLSVLAYAQGFTLWHYRAVAVDLADVGVAGFFDAASDMLAAGDIVMVSSPRGARIMMIAGISGAGTSGSVVAAPMC